MPPFHRSEQPVRRTAWTRLGRSLAALAAAVPGVMALPAALQSPAATAGADEVAATVLSDSGYAKSPAITSDGTDSYVAFSEDGPGVRVVTIRDEGARPEAAVTLSVPQPGGSSHDEPAIAAAGDHVYVAWDQQPRDGSDGEVYLASSHDRGATWTTRAIGAASTTSAYAVKVAASDSLVTVAYNETNTGQVLAVTSIDGGATSEIRGLGRIGIDYDLEVAGPQAHVAYSGLGVVENRPWLFDRTFTHSTIGRLAEVARLPFGLWLRPDVEAVGSRVHIGYTQVQRDAVNGSSLPNTHHIASSTDGALSWSTTQVSGDAGSCPVNGSCASIDIDVSGTRVHGAFLGQDRQVYEVLSVDQSFSAFDSIVHASDPHVGHPRIMASDTGAAVTWENMGSPYVVDDDGNRTMDVFESVRPAGQRTPASLSWTSDPFHSYGGVAAPTGSTYGMAYVRFIPAEDGTARSQVAFRAGSIGTPDLELLDVRSVQASTVAERLASGKSTVLRARLRNGVSRPSTFTVRWTYEAQTFSGPVKRVEDQRVTLAAGVRNLVFHPKQDLYVQEGQVSVHAQLDLANEVAEADETNNAGARTQEVVGVQGLTVLYVPLDVAGEPEVDCLNSVRLAVGRTSQFLRAAMPIDDLNTYHQSHCSASLDVPVPGVRMTSGALFTWLGMQKQMLWDDIDLVVAVAPDGFFERRTTDLSHALAGAVYDGDWGVVVVEERAAGGWVVAHELAHDRGWATPEASSAGTPGHLVDALAPGYHVDLRRQIDLFDFMAPKADVDPTAITRWTGPRTWEHMVDSFRRTPAAATAASSNDGAGEVVALSGALQPDGTVVAAPPQVVDAMPTASPDGDVTVRFLDAAGAELGRAGLDIAEVAGLGTQAAAEGGPASGAFRGTLAVPAGAATLAVDHGGQERFRATRSATAPAIQVDAQGPLTLDRGQPVPLTFTTTDTDGDAVTAHVEHSNDGGTTWVPSADGLVLGAEQMGHDVRYRVVATDGWHRTVADGPTVTVRRPLVDGELAHVLAPEGHYGLPQLAVAQPDGKAVAPLVTDPAFGATWPEWRLDGARLAFEAQGEIVTVAADGSDRRSLGIRPYLTGRGWTVVNASCPTWSPDGRWIAVHLVGWPPDAGGAGEAGIWVLDTEGTEPPRMVRPGSIDGQCALDWAADDRIWFLAGGLDRSEVFSMRPDGTEIVRRMPNPDPGKVAIWSLEVDPSAQLVLTTEAPTTATGGYRPAWITKVDGSGRRLLTDMANLDGDKLMQPSWSPEGGHVWALHLDQKSWDPQRGKPTYGIERIDDFGGQKVATGLQATHPAQRPVLADRTPEVPSLLPRIGSPASMPEGGRVTFDVTGTSAEAGIAGVSWDLDDDGAQDASGLTASIPAVDDGPVTAAAVITDGAGQQASAQGSAQVTNVAPSITSASATTDSGTISLQLTATDPGTLDELVATVAVGGTNLGERRLVKVGDGHRLDAELPALGGSVTVIVKDGDAGTATKVVQATYVEATGNAQAKAASATTPAGEPVVLGDVVTPLDGRTASVHVVTPPAVGTVDVLPTGGFLGGPAVRFSPPADAPLGSVSFEIVALGHHGYPEGAPGHDHRHRDGRPGRPAAPAAPAASGSDGRRRRRRDGRRGLAGAAVRLGPEPR